MAGIAETDSYAMLGQDRGAACRMRRTPGTRRPCQAERRDDPAVILMAATPGALRELIRAGYLARPVPKQAAP